jgi:hypothetical protein
MLPVNVLSFANASTAAPSAFKERARAYYNLLVTGFTTCELEEYHARLAVQVFNFGGNTEKIAEPVVDSPTEFWVGGVDAMPPGQAAGVTQYVNPWMRQRLMGNGDPNAPWSHRGARPWMEAALDEWIAGEDAMPIPRGGMYFDTEITLGGDGAEWAAWARSLQTDGRWGAPIPDVVPQAPGSQSLDDAWDAATQAFGWPDLPATPLIGIPHLGIDPQEPMQAIRNREYGLWFNQLGERAIDGALWYAAYDPIWKHDWDPASNVTLTLPNLPIANYGDFRAENRANSATERFGWHGRRAEKLGDLLPSRDGWLGAIEGNVDQAVTVGDFYCDECKKYPYTVRSGSGGGVGNNTPVAAWKQDHNRSTTANIHSPVFYPVPAPSAPAHAAHTQTNLYVPPSHPNRQEDRWDATLREARFTLDSMNFSGVSGAEMAPWIAPPSDATGIGIPNGNPQENGGIEVVYPTRDYFRRELMLMRSKEIPRIQVFNMKMNQMSWRNCARDVYDEVYRVTYALATTMIGTPAANAVIERVQNTTPDLANGAARTYDIDSATGSDYGKATTAIVVDFGGLPLNSDEIFHGLRLVIEGDVVATEHPSTLPTPHGGATFCLEGLKGMVYLYNWGTQVSPPGWVNVEISTVEPDGYRFPACDNPDLDLSFRREITVPFQPPLPGDPPQYDFVNSGGKARVLLVHTNSSARSFKSRWDLVQLAGWSALNYCGTIGASGTTPPPGEAAIGTPTGAYINFDGTVTAADLGDFSNAYSDAAPLADYNGDELVTSDDALTFLEDFVEQID